jgi:tetratricopeptide (TPR) repeat protein
LARTIAAAASLLVLLAAAPACVSALGKLPPLLEIGGGGRLPSPGEVDGLLERAGILYAGRTPGGVRESVEIWLEAARADTGRVEGLMGAARSAIWLADHSPDQYERVGFLSLAVQSARWCGKIAPENGACSYWIGAALGMQARERRSTALDALPRILEAFQRAASEEPNLERAGPDRALALLYARAPGWPTGPGSPDLAVQHARKAVSLEPDYPPNQLALAEALATLGEMKASRESYDRALDLARKREAGGEPDAGEWVREAEEALRKRFGG